MNRTVLAVLAASLTIAAAPSAFANGIVHDARNVARDAAHLRNDYSSLNHDQRELAQDRARVNYDVRTGNYFGAWVNNLLAGHEAREVHTEDHRIAHDQNRLYTARVQLNRDASRY